MPEGPRRSAFSKRASRPTLSRAAPRERSVAPDSSYDNHDGSSSPLTSKSGAIFGAPITLPIQLTFSQLRPIAYRIFSKKHGLNLKTSGLEALAEFIGQKFGLDWRGPAAQRFMDDVAKLWKQEDRGLFIERDQLQEIIREVLDLSQSMLVASRNQSVNNGNSSTGTTKQASILQMFNNQKSNTNGQAHRTETVIDMGDNDVPRTYDPSIIESIDTNIIAAKLAKQTDVSWKDYYKVISAFDQPSYEYSPKHKQFQVKSHRSSFLAPVSSRVDYFLSRYHFIYDSLLRQEIFHSTKYFSATSSVTQDTTRVITPINSLLGRDGQAFVIFGLLTQGANGKFWLQDPSGKVELDIASHALPSPGSYCIPGSLVITDGVITRDRFIVTTLGLPACEPRHAIRENFGFIDFLGLHAPPQSKSKNADKGTTPGKPIRVDRQLEQKLYQKEGCHTDHRVFILGCDAFLDKLKTLDSLRKLFTRLKAEIIIDSIVPVTFVFMGPFSSKPFQPNGSSSPYKDGMDSLAQIIQEYPEIFANTDVLFVPGDGDPWEATFSAGAPTTWPMMGIPSTFINRIIRAVPTATFSSNPCRLAYLSQEIMFVRDDTGARLRRNQVFFPALERRLRGLDENLEAIPNSDEDEPMEQLHNSSRVSRKNGTVEDDDVEELEEDLEQIVLDTGTDNNTKQLADQNKKIQELLKESSQLLSTPREHVDPDIAEARRVVKTLLDQGTLSPFPLTVRPVSWDYCNSLRLAPLPTLLVLADSTTPRFTVTYQECQVVNPGRLIEKGQIHWVEYTPSTRTAKERSMYLS